MRDRLHPLVTRDMFANAAEAPARGGITMALATSVFGWMALP